MLSSYLVCARGVLELHKPEPTRLAGVLVAHQRHVSELSKLPEVFAQPRLTRRDGIARQMPVKEGGKYRIKLEDKRGKHTTTKAKPVKENRAMPEKCRNVYAVEVRILLGALHERTAFSQITHENTSSKDTSQKNASRISFQPQAHRRPHSDMHAGYVFPYLSGLPAHAPYEELSGGVALSIAHRGGVTVAATFTTVTVLRGSRIMLPARRFPVKNVRTHSHISLSLNPSISWTA